MNIILVRHGQTDWNVQDLLQGRSDIELNENGKRQTIETANKLVQMNIDAIYVSPLRRTMDTANQINKTRNLKLNIENRLIERGFGNYEGQSKVEFRKYWNFESNMSDNGVEPIKELFERVYVLLKELNEKYTENETVLLVTHNGVNLAVSSIFCLLGAYTYTISISHAQESTFSNTLSIKNFISYSESSAYPAAVTQCFEPDSWNLPPLFL